MPWPVPVGQFDSYQYFKYEKALSYCRVLKIDPYTAVAEKNLKIMSTIDSRRFDRPGIIRMLRNKEEQRMWDVVVTHEFPMSEVEEAFKISATQKCGKILLYPHQH